MEISAFIKREKLENLSAGSSSLSLALISPIVARDFKNVKTPATQLTAGEWQSERIEKDLLVVMVTVRQTLD